MHTYDTLNPRYDPAIYATAAIAAGCGFMLHAPQSRGGAHANCLEALDYLSVKDDVPIFGWCHGAARVRTTRKKLRTVALPWVRFACHGEATQSYWKRRLDPRAYATAIAATYML